MTSFQDIQLEVATESVKSFWAILSKQSFGNIMQIAQLLVIVGGFSYTVTVALPGERVAITLMTEKQETAHTKQIDTLFTGFSEQLQQQRRHAEQQIEMVTSTVDKLLDRIDKYDKRVGLP